jgi:sugar/nucleoside kinase (ribokinase family)
MSTYDIYALGNALVDIEVEVSNAILKTYKIKKGHMQLVDYELVKTLKEAFVTKTLSKACGGSAANTIIGATQLGSTCYYNCKVSNDEMGQFYANDLKIRNVSSNINDMTLPQGHTGQCFIMITPDGERSMSTFLGITASLSEDEVNEDAIRHSKWVYIEGYLATTEASVKAAKKAIQIAKDNNVHTAVTLSDPFVAAHFKDTIRDIIGEKVTHIFSNKEEALAYTQKNTLEEAITALRKICSSGVVTLNSEGAYIFDQYEKHIVKTIPVKAVDSTGAGDAFAGAYLSELCKGHSHMAAAKLGNLTAAKVVAKFGPRLD